MATAKRKKTTKTKPQMPLEVLKKRAKKLDRLIKSREKAEK